MPKPAKDWDEEFKHHPPQPAIYAFVNHTYKDNVMHKLLRKAQKGEAEEMGEEVLSFLPRSVSAYDQATGAKDDTSDSSDSDADSESHDVWVLRKAAKKEKFKKETSV